MQDIINYIEKFPQLQGIIDLLSRIGLSIIVVIIGTVLIKISSKFITKTVNANQKLNERKAKTISTVCMSVSKYLIYFFVFCEILSIFGLNISSIIAIAGIGSVAVGFGAQSLVQDLITGLFILMEDQFGVGDVISIDDKTGTVEAIGIRTTRLRSADGNLYIIPNGQIKVVTNMSKEFNRAIVDIGIAYEENIDRVINIMKDQLNKSFESKEIDGLIKAPDVLGVVELAESSVNIRISADSQIGENWKIEREIRRIIKNRFDKEGISIPYPQREIHIINNVKEG